MLYLPERGDPAGGYHSYYGAGRAHIGDEGSTGRDLH